MLPRTSDDTRHLTRDCMQSSDSIHVAHHIRLRKLVGPFVAGGCITIITLMWPLSFRRDSSNSNSTTNFWVYVFLSQGTWIFVSTINYEMIYHAAFSQLGKGGATLSLPRAYISVMGYLAYLLVWIGAAYAESTSNRTLPIINGCTPALVVATVYGVAATSLIRHDDDGRQTSESGPLSQPTGQTDINAATFGPQEGHNLNQQTTPESGPPRLLRNAVLKQFGLATAYLIMFDLIYFALEEFALAFNSFQGDPVIQIIVFAGFCFANTLMKAVITSLGHQLDARKRGSVSLYYVAEVMCSLFYFSFYRLLFEAVRAIWQFAALQVIHLASEWFTYGFMASRIWFDFADCAPSWIRNIIIMRGASNREWACYVTNAFGVRIAAFSYPSIAFIAFKIFVVRGWNSDQYGNSGRATDADLAKLVSFILCSAGLELLNAWLMNVFFFIPNKLNLLVFMSSLFDHGRRYEFAGFVVVLTNNLLCNIFVPFVSLNFVGQNNRIAVLSCGSICTTCFVALGAKTYWMVFNAKALTNEVPMTRLELEVIREVGGTRGSGSVGTGTDTDTAGISNELPKASAFS